MSAPLPLQQRVLSLLEESGPVRAKDMEHWLPGYDRIGIDHALSGLMRANKVRLTLGSYDLVRPDRNTDAVHKKVVVQKPAEPVVMVTTCKSNLPPAVMHELAKSLQKQLTPTAPPTAAEEAAASLTPATAVCADCGPKPVADFQHSKLGKPFKVCIECAAKRQSRGLRIMHRRRLERSEGNPALPVHSKLGRQTQAQTRSTNENPPLIERRDVCNRDVCQQDTITSRTAARGGDYLAADPAVCEPAGKGSAANGLRVTDTPAKPPGSTEPPAISLEHPSGPLAQGTLTASCSPRDPEALSPVGAGTTAIILAQLAEKRRRWLTEIAALQIAIKSVDELVIALRTLEPTTC